MHILYVLLLIAALVCFAIAAFAERRWTTAPVYFVALGLLFWVLVPLIQELNA